MSENVSKPHSFQCTLQPLISDVSCFYDMLNSYRCIFLQLDRFWCWLKSTLVFIWKCLVSYDFSFSWSQSWLKCLTTGQQAMGTVMGLTDRWLVCLNTLSKVAHVSKRPRNASVTLYFLLSFFFFLCLFENWLTFYQCEILQTFFKYMYVSRESGQLFLSGKVFLLYFICEHFAISPSKTEGICIIYFLLLKSILQGLLKYKWRWEGNYIEKLEVYGGVMLQEIPCST